jgi:hypothetical protein
MLRRNIAAASRRVQPGFRWPLLLAATALLMLLLGLFPPAGAFDHTHR